MPSLGKRWTGSQWEVAPLWKVATSNGSFGETAIGKRWTGSQWEIFTKRIIDNFEDRSLAKYATGVDSSHYGDVSIVAPAFGAADGDYALRFDVPQSGGSSYVNSPQGGGLLNYPVGGETFVTHVYVTRGDHEAGIHYGSQAVERYPQGHKIEIDNGALQYRHTRYNGNSATQNPNPFNQDAYVGEWLPVVVHWGTTGNPHNAHLYDSDGNHIVSTQGTPDALGFTNFQSGGFGLRGGINTATTTSVDTQVFFDDVYIDIT